MQHLMTVLGVTHSQKGEALFEKGSSRKEEIQHIIYEGGVAYINHKQPWPIDGSGSGLGQGNIFQAVRSFETKEWEWC